MNPLANNGSEVFSSLPAAHLKWGGDHARTESDTGQPSGLFGLLAVGWQLRDENRQEKIESQIRLQDMKRELISPGIDDPELFEVLKDSGKADPTLTRRYL